MAHLDVLVEPSLALACQQDLATGGEQAVTRTLAAHRPRRRARDRGRQPPHRPEPLGARRDRAATRRRGRRRSARSSGSAPTRARRRDRRARAAPGTLAHDAATARRVLDAVPVAVAFHPSHFAVSGDDIPALVRELGRGSRTST